MAAVAKVLGGPAADVQLDAAVFEVEVKPHLLHEAVRAELNAHRRGTRGAKTRGLVAGGRAKPWRQKGTGRARAGSSTGPHWRGGGVAHGPKTRNYAQRTPKKMIRLALRSALSDRAAEDRVLVVDDWGFDAPSTKAALSALAALNLEGKVLVVLGDDDVVALKSFRNLPSIQTIRSRELNAYDVLVNDWVVFTQATLPGGEPAPAPAAEPAVEAETTEEEG